MNFFMYGVNGVPAFSVEQAWTDVFESFYQDMEQMPADQYHEKYCLFATGVLAGMTIVGQRIDTLHKKQVIPFEQAVEQAARTLTVEALQISQKEWEAYRK